VSFVLVLMVGAGAIGIAAWGRGPSVAPVANSTSDAPTTSAAPVTTVTPTTAAALETTTTEASATSTSTSWPPALPVLVAAATTASEAPTGLSTIEESGATAEILDGRFHVAASDGMGGLVFQAQVATEDANRSRGSIYRVITGTVEPVPILEQAAGHIIVMRAVEDIEGTPTLLFTESFGYESPETACIVLMAHDLVSGETREVAVVGGWESGIGSVSYGGGILAIEASAESEAAWLFMDTQGQLLAARFNPLVSCELGDVRCPASPTMAPDGRLVYVRNIFSDPDGNLLDLAAADYVIVNDEGIVLFSGGEQTLITEFVERSEIVAVDLATGAEQVLRSLFNERSDGEDGAAFLSLDFDGRFLIVNDRKGVPAPPAVVFDTREGVFVPLSLPGEAFFPLAPFDLPGVVQSPIG
jgi:hypothetical protein